MYPHSTKREGYSSVQADYFWLVLVSEPVFEYLDGSCLSLVPVIVITGKWRSAASDTYSGLIISQNKTQFSGM
jgi:hypothetical protein